MSENVSPSSNFTSEIPGDPHHARPHVYGVGRFGIGRFGGSSDRTRSFWSRIVQGVGAFLIIAGAAYFALAADTYTTNLNLRKPALDVEDPVTSWGEKLNNNSDLIDSAVLDKQAGGAITGNLSVTGTITAGTLTGNTSVYADSPILGDGYPSDHLRLDSSSATLLGPSIGASEVDSDVATQAELDSLEATITSSTDSLQSQLTQVAVDTTTLRTDVDAKLPLAGGTLAGTLTVIDLNISGTATNATIRGLTCSGGVGKCVIASTDEGDLYISTGTLAGQFRNARTGKGP